MVSEDPTLQIELDIERLRGRIDELLRHCRRLEEENRSLQDKQTELVAERARLIAKNDEARTRVEAMIARLKALETHT
jgi:cell division protein ZapB